MDDRIIFKPTAFKHGVTEKNIRQALEIPLYEGLLEAYANKYLALGYDLNANLLEIMYNRIGENTINVFHAMPCRRPWQHLANQ
jgi:D-alanine-D-alanine ligase-like ATP-grasp enzyme